MADVTANQTASDFEYVAKPAPVLDAYGHEQGQPTTEAIVKAKLGEGAWGSAGFHNLSGGARASGNVKSAHELLGPADLDWDPEFAPLMANGVPVPKGIGRAVVRSDNKFPIGIVGARYTLIPHRHLATLADAIVGEAKDLGFGNAGHKNDGARPFIQLSRERKIEGTKVEIRDLITMMTAHDGSLQTIGCYGANVIVCDNTYAHALQYAKGRGISIRHTASAETTLEEAIKVATLAQQQGLMFDNAALKLLGKTFTEIQMQKLAQVLIPGDSTRAENNRQKLVDAWENSPGAMPGRAWGAAQAVTYYTSHSMGTRGEATDLGFNLATGLGSGADIQAKAWWLLSDEGEAELEQVQILKKAI